MKVKELERTNKNKNAVIFLLIVLFISSWMIIPNLGKGIDKDGFCLRKLNKHFPEYNFNRAFYWGTGSSSNEPTCRGYYYTKENKNLITRDGLEEVDISKEEGIKVFKLINPSDIDYLESNKWCNVLIGIGFLLLFIGICVSIEWWKDY